MPRTLCVRLRMTGLHCTAAGRTPRLAVWLGCMLILAAHAVRAAPPEAISVASLGGAQLTGWLYKAQTTAQTKPLPTVVVLHGCGGLYATQGARKGLLAARHQAMADMLNANGYHAVFPDSFTVRGLSSICAVPVGQRSVTMRERRADVLATQDWVRGQAWADSAKVALLGWSNGGSAVLAATDASNTEVQAAGAPFATAIAFYPGCDAANKSGYRPNTALTLLLGQDDDWTPIAPCLELLSKLQSAPAPFAQRVSHTVYPNAVHGFDAPTGPRGEIPVTQRSDVPSRLHAGRGVSVGANPLAREAANAQVLQVLEQAFAPAATQAGAAGMPVAAPAPVPVR